MLATFCSPSRYTQGRNATRALGREMRTLGLAGPTLILASKTAARLCGQTWHACLDEVDLEHAVEPFGGE